MISLYPLMQPEFSGREACKHLILLEDHLNHPKKRCGDCIAKHFLAAEGFLEEAVALGNPTFAPAAARVRELNHAFLRGAPPLKTAADVRSLRKGLVPHCNK